MDTNYLKYGKKYDNLTGKSANIRDCRKINLSNDVCAESIERLEGGISSFEVSFISELNSVLDTIVTDRTSISSSQVSNPYVKFGRNYVESLGEIYSKNKSRQMTLSFFVSEYQRLMTAKGFGREMKIPDGLQSLNKKLLTGEYESYPHLRFMVYQGFKVSDFSIMVSELIVSKLLQSDDSREKILSILFASEKSILESKVLNGYEQDQFLKALSMGINNTGTLPEIVPIEVARGTWHDCAGFAISTASALIGGPWGMALGIAGMMVSAGGCEEYLGW